MQAFAAYKSSTSLVMPNCDPRDGFFYPTLTLRIDSYILLQIHGQVDYVTGDKPGPSIINFVDQVHADMVVMGTRGLGALKRMVMGSVSTHVLQNCHCPVSVIPMKHDDHQQQEQK